MFNLDTLVDVVALVAASKRERAVLWQDESGNWHPLTSAELLARVYTLANAFRSWGIVKGDRIALLAENRWEWPVVDFATLVLGAVDVPIYPTLIAEQVAALLVDSGARVAVVSTEAQYRKIASIRSQTPLERILVMDHVADLESTPGVTTLSSLLQGADASAVDMQPWLRSFDVKPEDLATLIYTSGTTGEPKGVMLTHGNIASNLNYSTRDFKWNANSSCISFLPLSHITARHLDYALFCYGATLAYCADFNRLPAALTAIQPTVFVAVPRVYEKIRDVVHWPPASRRDSARADALFLVLASGRSFGFQEGQAGVWRQGPRLYRWGSASGCRHSRLVCRCRHSHLRRLRSHRNLARAGPEQCAGSPHRFGGQADRIGGIPFAPDGELLVRGPFVFAGYWHKPEATREAIEADGWFHTGDIGRVDEDGFLYITDRKKELLKTSGGKMIAPQPIEGKLTNSVLVANAVVLGDRHKFLCALIAPNFPALEDLARQQGIAFSSRIDLISNPAVKAEYHALVHNVNQTLANFETIKRFHLVPDEWSMASGELTPTMKLRRRVVVERYAEEIAAIYHDESTAHR
jgi:long-chain acyl-CoA synthetase